MFIYTLYNDIFIHLYLDVCLSFIYALIIHSFVIYLYTSIYSFVIYLFYSIAKTRYLFTNTLYEHIDKQLCRATAARGMRAFAAARPLSPRVAYGVRRLEFVKVLADGCS